MIHRIRRFGSPRRFGDFPRSIYVPPREFRRRVENWVDFIEYIHPPEPRKVKRVTVSSHVD